MAQMVPVARGTEPFSSHAIERTVDSLLAVEADSLAIDLLNRVSLQHRDQGRAAEAISTLERAIAVADRSPRVADRARLRNRLGVTLARFGRAEDAVSMLRAGMAHAVSARDTLETSRLWGNLANAYSHLGRIPESVAASESAMVWSRRARNTLGVIASHHRLSGILLDCDRPEEALAWSDSAVALIRRSGITSSLGPVLSRQAALKFTLGDPAAALLVLDEAITLAEGGTDASPVALLRTRRVELLCGMRRSAEALALVDTLIPEFAGTDETVVLQLETLRGTALLDLGRMHDAERMFNDACARFARLRLERRDAASRAGLLGEAGAGAIAGQARCRFLRGDVAGAVAAVEGWRASSLRERLGAALGNDSLAGVQRLLRRESAALLIYNEPVLQPLMVFVITADNVSGVELGPVESTLRDSRGLVSLLAGGTSDAEAAPALSRVGDLLLPRSLTSLPDSIRRLFIVPAAKLSSVPFEALLLPGSAEELGSRFAISYAPYAGALLLLADERPHTTTTFAFGDPEPEPGTSGGNNSNDARGRRSRLPEARREARMAAHEGRLLLDAEASLANARSLDTRNAAVLHFATHAVVHPLRPEHSAIVLARGERWTAAEIESTSIAADLVVLSGCGTLDAFALAGEGTFGLARAFLAAGARTVVTSRWDVDDRAAFAWMSAFYDALRTGATCDAAAASARLALERRGLPHRARSAFLVSGVAYLPVTALVGSTRSSPRPLLFGIALAGAAIALFLWIHRARRREVNGPLRS